MKKPSPKPMLFTVIMNGVDAILFTINAFLGFYYNNPYTWVYVLVAICAVIWWVVFFKLLFRYINVRKSGQNEKISDG